MLNGASAANREVLMNNGSTESVELQVPHPATAIAPHLVRPDQLDVYIAAQTAITEATRRFLGFVGTEVLSPITGLQRESVAIFRLESNTAMKRWLDSPERQQLAARIEACLLEPSRRLLLASDDNAEPPVAMVFTHSRPQGQGGEIPGVAAQGHRSAGALPRLSRDGFLRAAWYVSE